MQLKNRKDAQYDALEARNLFYGRVSSRLSRLFDDISVTRNFNRSRTEAHLRRSARDRK
jgi:hypothetical protein